MKDVALYGLLRPFDAVMYAQAVCDVIGIGSNGNAVTMLLETCAAETLLGKYRDRHPEKHGVGLSQVDYGTFKWLCGKYADTEIAKKLVIAFGISLDALHYKSLSHSPLLAMIFCRLRYWTVAEPIPETREQRASYWKRHYNSSEGKGDTNHFIRQCLKVDVDGLLTQALNLQLQKETQL